MSLPDKSKLESLAKKTTAEKVHLGLPTSGNFWSFSESGALSAYYVDFNGGYTHYNGKDGNYYRVLCVGD